MSLGIRTNMQEHVHLNMQKCVIEHVRQKKTEQLTISVSTIFGSAVLLKIFKVMVHVAHVTHTHTHSRDAIYVIEIFVQCCAGKKMQSSSAAYARQ